MLTKSIFSGHKFPKCLPDSNGQSTSHLSPPFQNTEAKIKQQGREV
jgi:hypothetical protein